MMTLKMVVDRYREITDGWGRPAALSDFGWSPIETEKVFGDLDEDYHISRHLHFSEQEGQSYLISGEHVTHVVIDEGIANLL